MTLSPMLSLKTRKTEAQEGAVSSLRPPELLGPGGIRIEVFCRWLSFTAHTSPANGGVTPRTPPRRCLIWFLHLHPCPRIL